MSPALAPLLAERVEDHWQVRSLGAPHIGDRTEAELIAAFADRLQTLRPTLVSFNGHGFDLPVLRYRAMVNAIPAPGLSARPYYRRYDDSAVDLCDLLSSFDGRGKMGLDDLCKVLGLPGKPEASMVARYGSMCARAGSPRCRPTARPTSSTPSGCGFGMNSSGVS